jgi:orotate phosphoribosyltransferase
MLKHELAQAFLQTQSFKYDPEHGFRLASGVTSPFYVDCRVLLAHPRARFLVAQLACETMAGLTIDCVGGLEIGAIPLAIAISGYAYTMTPRREWRTFVVRKQVKNYGLGKLIEGAIHPGDHAVIVDDVLTSGASVVQAVRAAREANLNVEHALVVVDRNEQQGRALVEADGVKLVSLLQIEDLLGLVDTRRGTSTD